MENVYNVKLGTGKTVTLREMKTKYEDLAIKAVGNRAGNNNHLMQKMMGDELLKLLVMDVDGKKPSSNELEKIDELFTYMEIMSLRKVILKITGIDKPEGEEEPELIITSSSGAQ